MAGNDDIVALPAIETDDLDPTRQYIPLPGGWEVQTRGRGSSYRLLDRKTGERRAILTNDPGFIEDFVTRMALEVHAATSTALAERDATIERLKTAIFGRANYDPALTIGCFVEMALSTEAARQGALSRAETAERERDKAIRNLSAEARAHGLEQARSDTLSRERDEARAICAQVEAWWLEQGMHAFDGAPACIFSLRALLNPARAALTAKGGENADS